MIFSAVSGVLQPQGCSPSVTENEVIDLPSGLGIKDSCCFANLMTDVTE